MESEPVQERSGCMPQLLIIMESKVPLLFSAIFNLIHNFIVKDKHDKYQPSHNTNIENFCNACNS